MATTWDSEARYSLHFSCTCLAENIMLVVSLPDQKLSCHSGITEGQMLRSNRFNKSLEKNLPSAFKRVIPHKRVIYTYIYIYIYIYIYTFIYSLQHTYIYTHTYRYLAQLILYPVFWLIINLDWGTLYKTFRFWIPKFLLNINVLVYCDTYQQATLAFFSTISFNFSFTKLNSYIIKL